MANYCLVADLLGFQNIVINASPDDRETRLKDWIRLVKQEGAAEGVQYQLISDTVFAISDSSSDGLRALLALAAKLVEKGLNESFPLRAAVAHGDVTWSEDLVFGPAIVEGYRLENNQDWIGASCSANLPNLGSCQDLVVTYPVPMKSGVIQLRPAVRWNVPHSVELTKKAVQGNLTKPDEILEHPWARKIYNTALFGAYLRLLDLCGANPKFFVGFNALQLIETFVLEGTAVPDLVREWKGRLREARPSLFQLE